MSNDNPNSATGPLAMDKAGLESFLNDRLLPFKNEIDNIMKDDPSLGPTMARLIGDADIKSDEEFKAYDLGKPLAIGFMSKSDELGGKGQDLQEGLAKTIQSITKIYDAQAQLFKDFDEDLRETIEKLLGTQGENLTKVDGQKFLDIFEDVSDDLSKSAGSGEGGGGGGTGGAGGGGTGGGGSS